MHLVEVRVAPDRAEHVGDEHDQRDLRSRRLVPGVQAVVPVGTQLDGQIVKRHGAACAVIPRPGQDEREGAGAAYGAGVCLPDADVGRGRIAFNRREAVGLVGREVGGSQLRVRQVFHEARWFVGNCRADDHRHRRERHEHNRARCLHAHLPTSESTASARLLPPPRSFGVRLSREIREISRPPAEQQAHHLEWLVGGRGELPLSPFPLRAGRKCPGRPARAPLRSAFSPPWPGA